MHIVSKPYRLLLLNKCESFLKIFYLVKQTNAHLSCCCASLDVQNSLLKNEWLLTIVLTYLDSRKPSLEMSYSAKGFTYNHYRNLLHSLSLY